MKVITRENKFLLSFAFSMVALTIVTVSSVASNDVIVAHVQIAKADRAPSSINPNNREKIKPAKAKIQSVVLNLCEGEFQENSLIQIKGEFVQVKGKNCNKMSQLADVKIINKTNGYTASILPTGVEGEFQTDLIQLDDGNNQIVVQYQGSKGELIEQKIKLHAQTQSSRL